MSAPAPAPPRFDLSRFVEAMRQTAEVANRAFATLGDNLLRAMWPESYRALQRARAAAERAERIRRWNPAPLVIDGAAYRRRTRRRRR